MASRLVAVLLLLIAATPLLARTNKAITETDCREYCDHIPEEELDTLALEPIGELAKSGAAVIRIATTWPDGPVIDITHFANGQSLVAVHSMQTIGEAPRLIERTVTLPEVQWRKILERAQKTMEQAERMRLVAQKDNPRYTCNEHSYSSSIAVARDRRLFLKSACLAGDGIGPLTASLAREVVALLPGCDLLSGHAEEGAEILELCLMLNGDRRLAAQVANLVSEREFSDAEYSFAATEPQHRFQFTDDCWLSWPNVLKGANGVAACQKALEDHGHPDLAFDGFYGVPEREGEGKEVWGTGIAQYAVDLWLDDGGVASGAIELPFRITWRLGADRVWRIAEWQIYRNGVSEETAPAP